MARSKTPLRVIHPDPIYQDVIVSKLINHVMERGKKSVARKIVYGAFTLIKEKSKKEPLEIFKQAMENISPFVEVRSRRIGGATYQVPVEVKGNRKFSLALRWLLLAARSQKGKPMSIYTNPRHA